MWNNIKEILGLGKHVVMGTPLPAGLVVPAITDEEWEELLGRLETPKEGELFLEHFN